MKTDSDDTRLSKWQLSLALFVLFFAAWMLPRLPAIVANTLLADDFWLGMSTWGGVIATPEICALPAKDYRWVTQGAFCLQRELIPDWLLSSGPKYLAGMFIAAFATLATRRLTQWGVPTLLAILLALVIICHPIVNEITLWNTTYSAALWLCVILAAFNLLDGTPSKARVVLTVVLLTIVIFAYEIYLTVFLIFVASEVVIKRVTNSVTNLRQTAFKLSFFAAISTIYIAQVLLVNRWFGAPPGRGLATTVSSVEFFSEKIHGIFNLVVNLFMPIIGFNLGIDAAWSAWKWVPIALFLATFTITWLHRKRLLDACFFSVSLVALYILPTLPLFAASQSPESWRVSIPVLVAACFAMVPMLICLWHPVVAEVVVSIRTRICRGISIAILMAIIASELPVTIAESRLRVVENELDEQIVESIKRYWRSTAADGREDFRVGVLTNLGLLQTDVIQTARDITVAYRSRGLNPAFRFEWSWRGYLALKGIQAVELDANEKLAFRDRIVAGCNANPLACELGYSAQIRKRCESAPNLLQTETGIRVVHLPDVRISAVCL